LAAALLIAGCAAKPPSPLILPYASPPVTSLTGIAPHEIARVALFNDSCPVPYDDSEDGVIVTSCGRASLQSYCPLSGGDARFVVAAMRGVMPGRVEGGVRGRRFYLMIQLRSGRMFTATIPAEPHAGGARAAIIAGGADGTIGRALLSRLQAIAGRDGCLIAPHRAESAT
jgi:hypothetical protein